MFIFVFLVMEFFFILEEYNYVVEKLEEGNIVDCLIL